MNNGPLDWTYDLAALGERALRENRVASAAEREAIARVLDISSCEALSARFDLVPAGEGRYVRLTGTLEADVIQACIITLEPVGAHISEAFSAEFWAPEDIGASDPTVEHSVLEGEDREPMAGVRIEVGRVVFETLSAALDPYPRKSGAEFNWQDSKEGAGADPQNPFAVLQKLKKEK